MILLLLLTTLNVFAVTIAEDAPEMCYGSYEGESFTIYLARNNTNLYMSMEICKFAPIDVHGENNAGVAIGLPLSDVDPRRGFVDISNNKALSNLHVFFNSDFCKDACRNYCRASTKSDAMRASWLIRSLLGDKDNLSALIATYQTHLNANGIPYDTHARVTEAVHIATTLSDPQLCTERKRAPHKARLAALKEEALKYQKPILIDFKHCGIPMFLSTRPPSRVFPESFLVQAPIANDLFVYTPARSDQHVEEAQLVDRVNECVAVLRTPIMQDVLRKRDTRDRATYIQNLNCVFGRSSLLAQDLLCLLRYKGGAGIHFGARLTAELTTYEYTIRQALRENRPQDAIDTRIRLGGLFAETALSFSDVIPKVAYISRPQSILSAPAGRSDQNPLSDVKDVINNTGNQQHNQLIAGQVLLQGLTEVTGKGFINALCRSKRNPYARGAHDAQSTAVAMLRERLEEKGANFAVLEQRLQALQDNHGQWITPSAPHECRLQSQLTNVYHPLLSAALLKAPPQSAQNPVSVPTNKPCATKPPQRSQKPTSRPTPRARQHPSTKCAKAARPPENSLNFSTQPPQDPPKPIPLGLDPDFDPRGLYPSPRTIEPPKKAPGITLTVPSSLFTTPTHSLGNTPPASLDSVQGSLQSSVTSVTRTNVYASHVIKYGKLHFPLKWEDSEDLQAAMHAVLADPADIVESAKEREVIRELTRHYKRSATAIMQIGKQKDVNDPRAFKDEFDKIILYASLIAAVKHKEPAVLRLVTPEIAKKLPQRPYLVAIEPALSNLHKYGLGEGCFSALDLLHT